MGTVKEIAKKIPAIPFVYRALHNGYVRYRLKSKSPQQVFTEIHGSNAWGGEESVSGRGSDVRQTRIIIKELSRLFKDLNISKFLDIPCGDFHWMKNVDLRGLDYTGADIVEALIQNNREQYEREHIQFQNLNLIQDELPKVDLVFCRDCLVHLSFADVFSALGNVCNSGSEYLLTTTFTQRNSNSDIATGQWRALNLEIAPFAFPNPLQIVHEGCTEGDGAFADKALGLWRISDIRESLNGR